jgi:hypothetical protein
VPFLSGEAAYNAYRDVATELAALGRVLNAQERGEVNAISDHRHLAL